MRELISTLKKTTTKNKKRAQARHELSNILPKFSHARKNPPPPQKPSVNINKYMNILRSELRTATDSYWDATTGLLCTTDRL